MRIRIFSFILITFVFCFHLPAQTKTVVAVLQLRSSGLSKTEAEILTDYIRSLLVETELYDVVDRGRMNEILKEQGFQQSECTSDECAVEVGRLLGVQSMITGSVGKFGKLYTIELRIIDVETGKIGKSSRYNYEGAIEKLLTEGTYNALLKLLNIYEIPITITPISEQRTGQLIISSIPSGAEITVDNKYVGRSPIKIPNVYIGMHKITMKKDDYNDYSISIEVSADEKREVTGKLVPKFGYLTLIGKPEGSDIILDGEKITKTPIYEKKILTGIYVLKISKRGYKDNIRNIEVKQGKVLKENFVLVPLKEKKQKIIETYEEIIEEEVAPEEEEAVEEVVEEPSMFKPGWTAKVYVNFGPIEPWGDPGTGEAFDMGFKGQLGAQINLAKLFSLPTVLRPLSAEVLGGYTMFNHKSLDDVSTSIMSFYLGGRYDITDLILNLIGFEYPAIGFFGFIGFQVNSQSWDFPDKEVDPMMAFGTNLGIGFKYNLMSAVGKPVEIDLRFTQNLFLMGDVTDTNGDNITTGGSDYSHGENGFLLGIAYPF